VSQETIEIVRRAYADYADSAAERAEHNFTPDHVAYTMPEWPDQREFHGPDGMRELSDKWRESFDDFGFELHELRDAGDSVVGLFEMTGRVRGAGVPMREPLGVVHGRFRDGRIGETHYFVSWEEALRHAGLED
jgi:ketosteroid isomerase-like protein